MRRRVESARDIELLWPNGLGTTLAIASGRALAFRRGVPRPAVSTPQWSPPRGRHAKRELNAAFVAEWLVGHLPEGRYHGLVVGSPHGAAVHLALALGVPWLPVSFEVPTPDAATSEHPAVEGERLARDVLGANADVTVRQVFDPVWRGWSGAAAAYAVVRWRRFPTAYREFVAERLTPDAPILVVRDVSRWLTMRGDGGYTFQLGSRASGLMPSDYYDRRDGGTNQPEDSDGERSVDRGLVEDLRRFATAHGHPVRQVLYRHPDVLSGAVADLYREWLRGGDRTGNRLVVECGRLIDPWHVIRAGLVPYWCEHPLRSAVRALSWWLAGSEPYTSVEVLPEPPGMPLPTVAHLSEWEAIAAFASRHSLVDRRCARAYPSGMVPAHHATQVLRTHPYDLPYLPFVDADSALSALARSAQTDGLLVL
ncbi:hypothetical protein Drose_09200 [Dactylosporangium roseum]|uniref:Uncharacterized protein n=1 Tax=Dactylosporangium roseum TaxID=47989 RepID=A0ABY5Z8H4_9ACTN|nr:hypothetical protein [Dactylosporangium roseum]UWZ38395.1 hypothetical protein Drose_09200 [Dactylosporangium roseum]